MISSKEVKKVLADLGADISGIASIDRFADASEGFHPLDIYEKCRSVVVFAKRIPPDNIIYGNRVTYTHIVNTVLLEMDRICLNACCALEKKGVRTVAIPSDDPYEYWDAENRHGRGILSIKHAGELAGLGRIGKNTLLINERYGNMIYLGAFLTDQDIEPDPVVKKELCRKDCRICISECPKQALDGVTINQALCREYITVTNDKGFSLKNCSKCRVTCPKCLGVQG